jgi:hypothetical protein
MMADTVFNNEMIPVFVNESATVKRRLKAPYPESWIKVCIGETGIVVTIAEYLYAEKYIDVLAMLNELLRKQDLAMYKRNPDRLKIYVESSARKIIELVLKDEKEK